MFIFLSQETSQVRLSGISSRPDFGDHCTREETTMSVNPCGREKCSLARKAEEVVLTALVVAYLASLFQRRRRWFSLVCEETALVHVEFSQFVVSSASLLKGPSVRIRLGDRHKVAKSSVSNAKTARQGEWSRVSCPLQHECLRRCCQRLLWCRFLHVSSGERTAKSDWLMMTAR